jgi:hypothetical protein
MGISNAYEYLPSFQVKTPPTYQRTVLLCVRIGEGLEKIIKFSFSEFELNKNVLIMCNISVF